MQQDDNQKNLLLAVALSALILLGWQLFFVNPRIKDEQEKRARQEASQQVPGQPAPAGGTVTPGAPAAKSGSLPASAVAPLATSRPAAIALSPRVAIETPSLIGSIALKGGRIDDIRLAQYHETADPKSEPVVLLSPSGAPNPYYAELGWLLTPGTAAKVPDAATEWKAPAGAKLTPATPVTLEWDNGEGLVFSRRISVDDKFMFEIEDSVANKGAAPVVLDHRSVLSRHGTPKIEGFYILHEGLIGVAGEKGLQEIAYASAVKDLKDGEHLTKPFEKSTGGWFGITDKYWAAAIIPDQKAVNDIYVTGFAKRGALKESYQIDYVQRGLSIAPAGNAAVSTRVFAGAKKVGVIEGYDRALGIKQFDLMIDWGWFYFITKPLFHVIDWLAGMFGSLGLKGNFGLAILLTTVLIKGLFFPLANKSYESMAKMKKLQPEMEKLRERYKDDKMKQQQELMELYKTQKINPMAGCLPMLLQIPVFFALYKVLFVTIDMRHAPFYGWIRDLSAPDPTSLFNLFGLLPFAVPDFLHIGLWPIIMGFTMWVQMQLNPQQPDPTQQMIFNWMPVMFTFMLASFPVGLVIYWAWNNVLSLAQQYYISRKNGAEIHLWKNMGFEKLQAWLAARRSGSQG
ncbi:MAG: membrane protein insertase YidC [Hyphomicrobiaceae bacterium]|nr:membrane protein insertase YidC [Hyphomicrobiaceae bacterium]